MHWSRVWGSQQNGEGVNGIVKCELTRRSVSAPVTGDLTYSSNGPTNREKVAISKY